MSPTCPSSSRTYTINVVKILRSAAELIKNLGLEGREYRETKVNTMTGTDIWTKIPLKSKITDNADSIEPGTTMEERITTKGQMNVNTTNKTLDITRMEEIWGPISITTPQINCKPDPLPEIAGSPRPAKNNSDEPTDAPTAQILMKLRAGCRRHLCRRGD